MNEDTLTQALAWRKAGRHVALATVIQTWGSSPRPVGSHLAVTADGEFTGSVSGGCIEGEVIRAARQCMADGHPRQLSFGVSNEQAWEVGLACGGQVVVQVMSLATADWLETLLAQRAARQPVGLLMPLADDGNGADAKPVVVPASAATGPEPEQQEVQQRLKHSQSGILDSNNACFLSVYTPPPRLLIIGAVHIAQALIPMAETVGFEVILIDPRRGFASAERFPGVTLSHDWPDEALEALQPDAATAVVTLSHDPKLDDPALQVALAGPAFYIGSLGSRRTHARRLERLHEEGFDQAALARIHAPIGLDLGGRLPAEIAVAILAELVQARYLEAA
ncbi:MAG: XdhC family protein [Thiothrix sp.]|nr:XdhC family protein [Thiothrix sp.]HPE60858.1 XdhC/CoxI family protein [Thiolinea sp.]